MAIYVNGILVAGGGGGSGSSGGGAGHGVPAGGSAGQVLAKKSDASFDMEWVNAAADAGMGGGFVEMETSIPVAERKGNTLYGLILETY